MVNNFKNLLSANTQLTMPWNGRVNIAMFKSHLSSTLFFPRAVHGGR